MAAKEYNVMIAYAILVILTVVAMFTVVAVVPIGTDTITDNYDETQTPYNPDTITVYAGNITNITITANVQTKHWAGVYGDISGTIVLDDANNYTLYDWTTSEPKGEIYATVNQTTPDWASSICFNFTGGYGGLGNLSEWERFYNITYNDVDGIDETFSLTNHEAFDIGDVVTIATDTCPSTFMHVNDTFQTDKFSEILIQDSQGILVFVSIIENDDNANNTDPQGFKGTPFTPDFQMLLAEDGTGRVGGDINTDLTTYYFYVDLQ